jgi:large subunit ribosomal protein L22
MEAHAIGRYQRVSARKIGRILPLIRNRDVPSALTTLRLLNKPTKMPVLKALQSAVANAVARAGKARLEEKDLHVTEARVCGGPSMKRWHAGPRGTGMRYKHRTAHVYVKVATSDAKPAAAKTPTPERS